MILSTQSPGTLCRPFPSDVDKDLFGFGGVEQQIVRPPHSQSLYFIQVGRLIRPRDKSHHCGIISKFNNVVTLVGRGEVVGVEQRT